MSAFLRTASRAVARPAAATRTFSSTAARPVARITIVGNLADTPELRASSTGREYLRYAVASNSGRGENKKTSWFHVSCFAPEGRNRDFLQALPKGYVPLLSLPFALECLVVWIYLADDKTARRSWSRATSSCRPTSMPRASRARG